MNCHQLNVLAQLADFNNTFLLEKNKFTFFFALSSISLAIISVKKFMLVQAREGRNNFPMQLSRLGISLIDSFDSSQTRSNPLINEKPVYLTAFCRIFNV